MDFSVSGSDSWETTAAQEKFILNYFQDGKLPVSSKALKKGRKRVRERNLEADEQHHQKKKKLMKISLPESSQTTELDSITQFPQKQKKKKLKWKIKNILESNESNPICKTQEESSFNHGFLCTENKNTKKLKNKNKNSLTSNNDEFEVELAEKIEKPVYQENEFLALEPNSPPKNSKKKRKISKQILDRNEVVNLQQKEPLMLKPKSPSKKKLKNMLESNEDLNVDQNESLLLKLNSASKNLKKKKMKKILKLNEDLDSEPKKSLQLDPNSVTKKKTMKKTKKTVELDDDLDIEEISEDSYQESDEELVSEIKNSDVFKEIKDFMKQSPSLSNLKDSDESVCELSDENSEESFDELHAEESDDSSSDGDNVPKNIKVAKIVPESSKLPKNQTSSSKVLIHNTNEKQIPVKVSKDLNLQNDVKSLAQNVNSKMQTVASSLKNKAWEKLKAAKFRYLNEKLYTETGESAFHYFQENVDEYHDYHQGYSLQVTKWPINPVNKIISDLQNLEEGTVIADMGCGDAKIAETLTNCTVHSYDIVALNEFVTACDISKVPLSKETVDVVVFCLSLMGTNLKDYLIEAHRILKMGGTLKIAEVESRIDVNPFVKNLKFLGFSLQKQDMKHKVFVFLDFKKEKKKFKKASIPSITMRPCLYKKR